MRRYLPCFKCGRNDFRSAFGGDDIGEPKGNHIPSTIQPCDSLVFRTYGHYGSTFWDSFEGEQVVIFVCDDCMRRARERVAFTRRIREYPVRDVEFTPDYADKMFIDDGSVPSVENTTREELDTLYIQLNEARAEIERLQAELYLTIHCDCGSTKTCKCGGHCENDE